MSINISVGEKILVTTDHWFYAPDGKQYRAVWGTVKGVYTTEQALGVKPNAKSMNWYACIGNMTIAGCQIHYAIKTDYVDFGHVRRTLYDVPNGAKEVKHETEIYNADSK
jgi:hypothetical protein